MKQGFDISFYGKIQFKKDYPNVSRCILSAFDFGYVNIPLVAFKDSMGMLEALNNDDWVVGTGRLTTNEYKGEKKLQIILEKLEQVDEPERSKDNSNFQRKQKQSSYEPKKESNIDVLDIPDEDLPF